MSSIDFSHILKKWWLFIIIISLATVVATFGFINNISPLYQSSTKIFVSTSNDLAIANINDAPYADRAVKTVSVLVNSNTLEKTIVEETGASLENLNKNLKVKSITGAQLIEITYSDTNSILVSKVLNNLPVSLEIYLQKLQKSTDDKNRIKISIAEEPADPIQNKSTKFQIFMLIILSSLFIGYIIAYLIEFFDNTFKSELDLDNIGIQHLGNFGILKKFKSNPSAILKEENIMVTEMMRQIRTNINFLNTNNKVQTIIVTSANPREGKSLLVSNLAIMLAESGKKVILIDADLHAPTINKIFGVTFKKGFSEFLFDDLKINDVLFKSQFENLWLIGAGKKIFGPGKALNNADRIKELIKELSSADFILFDTPPIGLISDASIISQLSDGVILAIEKERTNIIDIQKTLNIFAKINVKILGGILTKSQENRKSYCYSNKRNG